MKIGLATIVDDLAKVAAGIDLLSTMRVMVGVPADKAGRRTGPINNAALALIHDTGAPEANIPARPFMIPGIESVHQEIEAGLKRAGELALDGRGDAVERQYHRVGTIGRDAIKMKITEGIPPPLADSTLRKRAARAGKRTGVSLAKGAERELASRAAGNAPGTEFAKPLIDTGSLRNAISYTIRKGVT